MKDGTIFVRGGRTFIMIRGSEVEVIALPFSMNHEQDPVNAQEEVAQGVAQETANEKLVQNTVTEAKVAKETTDAAIIPGTVSGMLVSTQGMQVADSMITPNICELGDAKYSFDSYSLGTPIVAQKATIKQVISKEEVSKEEVSKEEVSKEEVSKEEVSKEEVSKEEVGKEEVSKEELIKEAVIKEAVSKEEVSGACTDVSSVKPNKVCFLSFVLWQQPLQALLCLFRTCGALAGTRHEKVCKRSKTFRITHAGQMLLGEYFDCKVVAFDETKIDVEVHQLLHHKINIGLLVDGCEKMTLKEHFARLEAMFPLPVLNQTYLAVSMPTKNCVQYMVASE